MPTHTKSKKKITRYYDAQSPPPSPPPKRKPRKIIKKKEKMKVPTITITEAPKKIKKKEKPTKPVPPLEKKKFKIKLPKEEQAKQAEKPKPKPKAEKPKPKGKGPAKPKKVIEDPEGKFNEAMRIYDEKIAKEDIDKEIEKNKEMIKGSAFKDTREGQLAAIALLRRIARADYEEKQRRKFRVKKPKAPKVEAPKKEPREKKATLSQLPIFRPFEKLKPDEKTGLYEVDFGRSSAMLLTEAQAKKYLALGNPNLTYDEKEHKEMRKDLIKNQKVKTKRLFRQ